MQLDRPSRLPLAFWLILSLAIHIALLLPLFLGAMHGSPARAVAQAHFKPDSIDRPEMPEQIQLGIEESDASTMTWIGYEEYEEHLAQLDRVEQAAFDLEPPTPVQPLIDVVMPEAAPAEAEAEPTERAETAETPTAEPEPQQPAAAPRAVPVNPMEFLSSMSDLVAVVLEQRQTAPATKSGEQQNQTPTEPNKPQPAQEQPAKPTPAEQPPTETVNPSADQSDRESDASSIIEVPLEDVKLGKPLAAKGLELKPARPKFTTLQLVTLAPCCNPLTRVEFTRDGRPLEAVILETSGHALIDEAVEASLYRWRAEGEDLTKLKGDQTIAVEIRILLIAE